MIGFFLILNGGDDEAAFWLFVAISKVSTQEQLAGIQGFYEDSFPLYHQFVYIFSVLFEERQPELKEHLDMVGMMPAVWLQKWFMTLFLYSFPMHICIRVWDNMLVEGSVFMLKFPLAIMEQYETTLLEMDLEAINDFFESLNSEDKLDESSIDAEVIIQRARSMKVSHEEIKELRARYKAEMAAGKEKVIMKIPFIDEKLINQDFLRRPSEGLMRF